MTNRQMKKIPGPDQSCYRGDMHIILIAVIGSIHGQTMPRNVKGCIGTDQTSGRTFIDIRCLYDWKTVQDGV